MPDSAPPDAFLPGRRPDRLAQLYVVGVPLVFCAILTGLSVVPRGDDASSLAGAGSDWPVLLAGLVAGGMGLGVLRLLLRRPRGIGPSTYPAPTYIFGGLLGLMAYIVVAGGCAHLFTTVLGWGNTGQLLANAVGWIPALAVAVKLEQHGRAPTLAYAPAFGVASWLPVLLVLYPVGLLNVALLDVCGLGAPAQAVMTAFKSSPSVGQRILFIVSVCAIAPVCEEMIFRGVLYRGMRDMAGKAPAVVGSALLFTAIHLTPTHVMGIFTVGCVLALLYERTGTIVAPMVLHAAHNTLALFGAEYLPG